MSDKAATALTAPTAEETSKAPASGTDTTQDTNPTGSGEATLTKEHVASRSKPEDIQSADEWAKNVEALNRQFSAEKKADGAQPPAEAPQATTTEPAPPVETAPPAPAAPAAAAPEAVKPPEETEEAEEQGRARVRLNRSNFRSDDDYKVAVKGAKLMNEFGLTPAEAETEARRLLKIPAPGASKPADAAVPEAPVARADGKPASIAETDAKIAELRAKRTEALTTHLDHAQYDALTNEIESLTEHKSTLRDEANERAVRQRNDFHSKATSSQARAVQEFPDCAKKDSSLVKEMIALDAEWKEDGNPLYHSPDKPYLLAQRASARLQRLAPAAPAAPAASPQPVVSRPVEPAAPVAPGNARTTQAAPQNGQQLDRLNKISSVADYDAALKEFGLPAAV